MVTVYGNGNILTMEGGKNPDYISVKDGIIEKIGFGRPGKSDRYIDLDGRTLMPSFIDSHSHLSGSAYSLLKIDLGGAESIDEILKKIKVYIEENKKEHAWITAGGYDHNELREKRHITSSELDGVSGSNAVVIEHRSGHFGVFNTEAARRLEICDAENGLLKESEYIEKTGKIPSPDIKTMTEAFKRAQRKYFSYGITTAQEGYGLESLLPLYRQLVYSDALDIDTVVYPDFESIEKWQAAFPNSVKRYDRNFKIGGMKIMLDGSPQGKTAWVSEPYIGGGTGFSAMTDEQVAEALGWAKERNIQVIAHCNGDMACGQFIEGVERIGNRRAVIIHAQLIRENQLDKVKEYGMIPSFFAGHIYHWGDVHIENLGLGRAEKISPLKSALDRDILFTLHQDSPVTEPDMFETIWCAVTRQTKNGITLGKSERIDRLSALRAVTYNAAFQYGEEDFKGSIRVGAAADLIITDDDPLKAENIRKIRVLETIKRGKTVYKA